MGKTAKRKDCLFPMALVGIISNNLRRNDLLSTFPTKRTPIINVQFTPRNLCLVSGTYQAPDPR
jgi:hypothetical protein